MDQGARMNGPRSLHVVSNLRLSSGGVTQSATRLCEALNTLSAPAEIATLSSEEDLPWHGATRIHRFPMGRVAKLHRSDGLNDFLMETAPRFDLIHVHGLWQWHGLYARRAATLHHKPLVISPRGMIEPWSLGHRAFRKRIARILWEETNWQAASLFHATSQVEAASLRSQGLHQPIAVIPNGVEAPEPPSRAARDRRTLLFLSRLHPIKGLEELVRAWAVVAPRHPDWDLVIAGPDENGYGARMKELALGLSLQRTTFHGPMYGQEKWEALRAAALFILPSHSENFGNVIPEALSQGTPVLTTHGTPWQELESEGCGWWIPLDELVPALDRALGTPRETLNEMGRLGRAWTADTLGWPSIAHRMASAYAWLLERGPKPACLIASS